MDNYVNDFTKINGNKYSKEESEKMFLGLLFYMINDRDVFKLNEDIKDFIEMVFEHKYKDYLYRSRPILASRLMNDIRKEKSYGEMLQINKKIVKYFENSFIELESKANNKKEVSNTNISGWLKMKSGNIDE
ncbi:hypothetical protein [Staphylococcus equorum]|uniref:hypothetical protein n=1 Tax=Staphylococcus equorum TaxID=246432 RepID=UPI002555366A|nr:hypothetical protein [Staphylococcus equorum]MDK9857687.1 hypothetical protein [Staphylococcus equorum]MDK9874747.1 hypothetical protein [Staphylococcus equorum]